VVRSRADVEEIALRLERCFDDPFVIEGYILHGSASVGIALYPEDGATKDSLLSPPTPPCTWPSAGSLARLRQWPRLSPARAASAVTREHQWTSNLCYHPAKR
jgi:hypothetical protein